MKLINSVGPNPRVVRMFIAELGIDMEVIEVDLMAGENRQPDYLSRNPSGTTPALQLDDGKHIAEITAICEYLDEKHGHTDLIGGFDDDECDDVVATDEWFRTHVFHAVVHTDLVKLPHGSEVSTRLPPWDVLSTVSR